MSLAPSSLPASRVDELVALLLALQALDALLVHLSSKLLIPLLLFLLSALLLNGGNLVLLMQLVSFGPHGPNGSVLLAGQPVPCAPVPSRP